MTALLQIFADARGHREEARRARKLADVASGQLQNELQEIAALYELLADGKAEPDAAHSPALVGNVLKSRAGNPLDRFMRPWPPDYSDEPGIDGAQLGAETILKEAATDALAV
jgi:hypothetical protein